MRSAIQNALSGLERINTVETLPNSHHYIVLSLLSEWMRSVAAPASAGTLLDFGCGGQPYRKVFEPYIERYIGADVAPAAGVELDIVLTPGAPAPLLDASVDTILSTQVLEHVFDFNLYLTDCARLLRPQGKLIISAPMHWRHHEVPYDYWRFTKFGLWASLERAGFTILDFRPCGGVYALLGQILQDHRAINGRSGEWVTKQINRLALWLDAKYKDQDDTLGWMCIAEISANRRTG